MLFICCIYYLFVHFYLIFYNLRGICFDMDKVLKDVLDLSSVNKLCLKYDIWRF